MEMLLVPYPSMEILADTQLPLRDVYVTLVPAMKGLLGLFLGFLLLFFVASTTALAVDPTCGTCDCASQLKGCTDGVARSCSSSEIATCNANKTTTTTGSTTVKTAAQSNDNSIFLISGMLDGLKQLFQDQGSRENVIQKAKYSEQGIFEGTVEAVFGKKCTNTDNTPIKSCIGDAGAMGILGHYTTVLIDNPPPIHTTTYLASIVPITQAHAATGRDILNPIQNFWQAIRNITYGLFVVVLIAIGFMIMFRTKLDPRTTVSVVAALPNIVISLVLITFSLTLAGLLIDLGTVLTKVAGNILLDPPISLASSNIITASPGDVFSNFTTKFIGSGISLGDILVVSGLASALFNVVIAVVAIFITFNIFFMLLFRWAALLVKPIFAPLTFLFGALPGNGGLIGSWFKGYLVDVLVFPLTLFMLNLAKYIMDNLSQFPFPDSLSGGGQVAANIAPLVTLGVLVMIPKIPALLEEALDVKPSPHVGKAGVDIQRAAKSTPIVGRFIGG